MREWVVRDAIRYEGRCVMAITHITLLHSNDMHGAFLPTDVNGVATGGISLLSGYVRGERKGNPNTAYVIAGDMFRGSVIDSEFLGLSTIDLVNILRPDVATIGNHEVDYGLAHLLFLEKCARFPIINADLFVTLNNARLFQPFIDLKVGGLKILCIGILTNEVLSSTKTEAVIGSFVDIKEAAREIGIICDNYRTTSTDLTVLITHIGIEKDRELAALLNPDWGVNFIIGGHSHTFMDEPEIVNGVPIVQAGYGTGQIGRLEIDYDTSTRELLDYDWECVPINENTAEPDPIMEKTLETYRDTTDRKYHRVVTHLARTLTHPAREQETELGNLYADILVDGSSYEIMLMGSGSIRKEELGPIVEYQDMIENTPFDGPIYMIKVTGAQFRRMVSYVFRDGWDRGETEFYQVSTGVRIVWRKSTNTLEALEFKGEPVTDDQELTLGLQDYHFNNFEKFFGVPFDEVTANMRPRMVITQQNNVIEEYLSVNPGLDARVEGRITVLD